MAMCLDTDFLVDSLADRPGALAMADTLPGLFLLSSMTVYELLSAATERRMAQVEGLARDYAVIPADYAVASLAAEIQRDLVSRGELLPHLDALIAATAILANAPLVTSDPHNDRIPPRFGLALRWYKRGRGE